jgi:peptide chain release factor 2
MNFGGIFDYPAKERKLNEVNAALEDPKVWDNPKRAQELGKEKKSLEDVVQVIDRLSQELADNSELFEMSKSENDEAGMQSIESDAAKVSL